MVEPRVIRIVSGVDLREGKLLVVRKQGTGTFILPGGKPEEGETPEMTLSRELSEELGCSCHILGWLGVFAERAANEPDCRVEAKIALIRLEGEAVPAAEIAEICRISVESAEVELAPLLRTQIIPALKNIAGSAA